MEREENEGNRMGQNISGKEDTETGVAAAASRLPDRRLKWKKWHERISDQSSSFYIYGRDDISESVVAPIAQKPQPVTK